VRDHVDGAVTARVVAASVQVTVGGRVHHCARGTDLPDGVETETVERLVAKGLVELVEDKQTDDDPEATEEPSESWNHERIDGWAAEQEPPIELVNPDPNKQFTKKHKLEQIAAALAARAQQ
jgi:hypothetical protein